MKRVILSILLIAGVTGMAFGQINDQIKGRSNSNRTGRTSGSSSSGSSSSGNYSGGDDGCGGASCCVDACATIGCMLAMESLFRGMWGYNRRILDKKPYVPRVISLEVIPEGGLGLNTPNTFVALPRVRGNLGLFSTDFRFYNRFEGGQNYLDTWKTLEWQILQLNLIQARNFNLRIGSGIYVEQSSGGYVYNEHTLGMSVFAWQDRIATDLEGRIVTDYATGNLPRQEINLGARYKFLDFDNFAGYAKVGGAYQNFYRGLEAWTFTTGLHFVIQ